MRQSGSLVEPVFTCSGPRVRIGLGLAAETGEDPGATGTTRGVETTRSARLPDRRMPLTDQANDAALVAQERKVAQYDGGCTSR